MGGSGFITFGALTADSSIDAAWYRDGDLELGDNYQISSNGALTLTKLKTSYSGFYQSVYRYDDQVVIKVFSLSVSWSEDSGK